MNLSSKIILNLVLGVSLLFEGEVLAFDLFDLASGTWCISNPAHPPCDGAPGKCTINQDFSLGGFVADTANVPKFSFALGRNQAHIGKNVQVCDQAKVSDQAWIDGYAKISEYAWVSGNAQVSGNAHIHGSAFVLGDAQVYGNAQVYGESQVSGSSQIYENAHVLGETLVSGNAKIFGNARVLGFAEVAGLAEISGFAEIFGTADITGMSVVSGFEQVDGTRPWVNQETPSSEMLLDIAHEKLKVDRESYSEGESKNEGLEVCPVCLDTLQKQRELVITSCQHFICLECYKELRHQSNRCPMCRDRNYRSGALPVTYPAE